MTKQEFKNEWIKFSFSLLATAIGFSIALWVNTYQENNKDREIFKTTQRMLLKETEINQIIVDSSYVKFASSEGGVILGELSVNVSNELIKDQNFISHTNDSLLTLMQNYHRYINILNTYKTELNSIRKSKSESYNPEMFYSPFEAPLVRNIIEKRNLLTNTINSIAKNIRGY